MISSKMQLGTRLRTQQAAEGQRFGRSVKMTEDETPVL